MARFNLPSLAAAAFLVATLFASAPSTGGMVLPPWDKVAHFAFFGTVAFLLAVGLGRRYLLALLLACLVGLADEAYQSLLPGRHMEAADLFVDFAAASLAVLAAHRLPPMHTRRFPASRWRR